MKVLSTKILTKQQRVLLENYRVQEVPMIEVVYGSNFVLEEQIKYAVFTSGNSVKSVFDTSKIPTEIFENVFCVGSKTKVLLENRGVKVQEVANNATELSEKLTTYFKDNKTCKKISWFCGNLRNNDLPTLMAENGVLVTEYIVYQTNLLNNKVDNDFEVILFFSPSGVKGYAKTNKIFKAKAICIGSTTATEAVNYFEEVYMAETQSVEGVIRQLLEMGD